MLPRPYYPRGVPSPLTAHAHPYPTRFHGANWTRPVFGRRWVTAPTNVHQMQGLGMTVETADGIFYRPGGRPSYGGGVFDGNSPVAGLGVLGGDSLGTYMGDLGAQGLGWTTQSCDCPPKGVNPSCSAFWTCHDTQFAAAQQNCYGLQATPDGFEKRGYADFDDCVYKTRDVLIDANCLKYCAQQAVNYRGGDPCSSGRAILYAQQKLGVKADGSWGPLSQAALDASGTTFQGLIGCTGGCASGVKNCSGQCQSGYEVDPKTGLCVKPVTGCPAWASLSPADCDVTSGRPSGLIKKLQSQLGVQQTGVLDMATCTAWHQKIPQCGSLKPCPLNLVNIMDTVSGACKPRLCDWSQYAFPPDPCKAPAPRCGAEGQPCPCCSGFECFEGKCRKPPAPPPKCGSEGQACPCCGGLECFEGKCRTPLAVQPPAKAGMGMMWVGLAAVAALGLGAYAMSEKKKPRRRRAA